MTECPICGKEVTVLRKHTSGKWHNNQDDFEHLRLALELSPGASAYLKENLEEVSDATRVKEPKGGSHRNDRHRRGESEGTFELEQLLNI